jgi:hypothetical protein
MFVWMGMVCLNIILLVFDLLYVLHEWGSGPLHSPHTWRASASLFVWPLPQDLTPPVATLPPAWLSRFLKHTSLHTQ